MKAAINCYNRVKLISVKASEKGEPSALPEMETTAACQGNQPSAILEAARIGDMSELERLLQQKITDVQVPLYPQDWQYTFDDLLITNHEGRTALHLAACFGNHTSALECVEVILRSQQVLCAEDRHGTAQEKTRKILEYKDNKKETALHLAIENKATAVVSFLLGYNANTIARNKDGMEALQLIYQQVPDAMKEIYDSCITLEEEDHTSFSINWGPVVGFRRKGKVNKKVVAESDPPAGNQTSLLVDHDTPTPKTEPEVLFLNNKETQCISYILSADKWGAALLRHPLIKWYLYLKWKKVHWFFWITFVLQILWLSLYAIIFVKLHLSISGSNCTETVEVVQAILQGDKDEAPPCRKSIQELDVNWLWHAMMVVTTLESVKEVYQAWVLKTAYLTSENLLQIVFIFLFATQYIILLSGLPVDTDIVVSVSAMTIILSAILMIFQMGKTPRFGLQVAAFKKVINSCTPHLPIFFVWFIGFGLAFWAMFYNAEISWTVGMLAIVAAMGTGELNAKDHLEKVATGSFSLPELIHVFCILLFVIVIVTLYFNLLIGYAVTDLQVLLPKAEMLQLSNQLSTIYTIESFLVSTCGRFLLAGKCKISSITYGCRDAKKENLEGRETQDSMESIYVLPPSQLHTSRGSQKFKFTDLPKDQLEALREIAFNNFIKAKQEKSVQSKITGRIQNEKNGIQQVRGNPDDDDTERNLTEVEH